MAGHRHISCKEKLLAWWFFLPGPLFFVARTFGDGEEICWRDFFLRERIEGHKGRDEGWGERNMN